MAHGMLKIVPDMVKGPNGKALMATFQGFCSEGVIVSDVATLYEPRPQKRWLIIGYCRVSEMVETQCGGPLATGFGFTGRLHEGKRHELRISLSPFTGMVSADDIINKLALLRD